MGRGRGCSWLGTGELVDFRVVGPSCDFIYVSSLRLIYIYIYADLSVDHVIGYSIVSPRVCRPVRLSL